MYSQNTLKIIEIIEKDSSIIKTQFNNKPYYAISYSRFNVSAFKASRYDSGITLIPFYKKQIENDSLVIIKLTKNNTNLMFDNKYLKDTLFTKNRTIDKKDTEIVILKSEKEVIKSKSYVKSVIIVGLLVELLRKLIP